MPAATLDAFLNSYAGPARRASRWPSRQRSASSASRAESPPHRQSGRALHARSPEPAASMPTATSRRNWTSSPTTSSSMRCVTRRSPLYASEELERADPARHGRAAGHCHRPARRLLQHRHQCVDRNDFLPPPGNWCAGHRSGRRLLAGRRRTRSRAGFFIYGPQLALVLSLGSGTHVFVLSTRLGTFVQAYESRIIPPRTQEFAINASNYRHWDEAVRLYVDDCVKGCEGPREQRLQHALDRFAGGGVLPHPDARRRVPVPWRSAQGIPPGAAASRLRGEPDRLSRRTGGRRAPRTRIGRILEIDAGEPAPAHAVVFGSAKEVDRIARYHTDPSSIGERAPLFGIRGLFRA